MTLGPTPAELDEILQAELERCRWTWRHPFRRRGIHLPAKGVVIGMTPSTRKTWRSIDGEPGSWRYTASQAYQMRRALIPVLRKYHERFDKALEMLSNQAR